MLNEILKFKSRLNSSFKKIITFCKFWSKTNGKEARILLFAWEKTAKINFQLKPEKIKINLRSVAILNKFKRQIPIL